MALHKDQNGKLHDDMDGAALHLLPVGCIQITQAEADALLTPPLTQTEQFKLIEQAIELHMDAVAHDDGWDNRWTCVARAGYLNQWQTKAIKFAQWMDSCWAAVIQAQADVIAGTRTMPTPEQAVAELPQMVW